MAEFYQPSLFSIVAFKYCSACEEHLPRTCFSRKTKNKDGTTLLQNYCKTCSAKINRRYREKNKESISERGKKYRENNAARVSAQKKRHYNANSEHIKAQIKQWRSENRDHVAALGRKYRAENKEQVREDSRRWRRLNPDYLQVQNYRRRARLAEAEGDFTRQEWLEVLQRFDHKCLRCGATEKLSADHVIPLARGGRNSIENIQPLCVSCNCKKGLASVDYRGDR